MFQKKYSLPLFADSNRDIWYFTFKLSTMQVTLQNSIQKNKLTNTSRHMYQTRANNELNRSKFCRVNLACIPLVLHVHTWLNKRVRFHKSMLAFITSIMEYRNENKAYLTIIDHNRNFTFINLRIKDAWSFYEHYAFL